MRYGTAHFCLVLVYSLAAMVLSPGESVSQPRATPLEEIIVTSERRALKLDDIPRTVSVLTADDITSSALRNSLDLTNRIPALTITSNSILGQPYLRGIGSDLIGVSADSSVAVYVDGIYQTRAVGSIQDFFDLERVEVIKGPASTLYGRNATGGVISYISRKPNNENTVESRLTLSNYDGVRVEGAANAVAVPDRVFLRLSGLLSTRDGFANNVFLGTDVDDEDYAGVRAQIEAIASKHTILSFTADYSVQDDSRGIALKVRPDGVSPARDLFGGIVPIDARVVSVDRELNHKPVRWGLKNQLDYDLGWGSISATTAYRDSSFNVDIDVDSTQIPFFANIPFEKSRSFTEDLQLASTADARLRWIVGAFYLHEDAEQFLDLVLEVLNTRNKPISTNETDALAIYGQFEYDISSSATASLGLRYSYEKKRQTLDIELNGVLAASSTDTATWHDVSPRFALSYKPSANSTIYASITKGFKSGGFNSASIQPGYDPESLWSYEAGARYSFWQNKLQTNVAAFYYDYSDIQVSRLDPGATFPTVDNAAKARVLGLEWDLTMRPSKPLEIKINTSLLDAKYTSFVTVDENNPSKNPDQSGNSLANAPSFSLFASTRYTLPLPRGDEISVSFDYTYRSRSYFSVFADPFVSQGGYGIFGGRISYQPNAEDWQLSLYGRNLGDRLYKSNVIRTDALIGTLQFPAPPRVYGIELSAKF